MRPQLRPRIGAAAVAIALAATLTSPAAIVLAGEPNGAASCAGIEMAAISPPGSSDEEPGGAPEFIGEVMEIAAFLGLPPGRVAAFIASLHEGSHVACDEALAE